MAGPARYDRPSFPAHVPFTYSGLRPTQRDALAALQGQSIGLMARLETFPPTPDARPIPWEPADLDALVATATATAVPRLVERAEVVQHCCRNLVERQAPVGDRYRAAQDGQVQQTYATYHATALLELHNLQFGALVLLDVLGGARR